MESKKIRWIWERDDEGEKCDNEKNIRPKIITHIYLNEHYASNVKKNSMFPFSYLDIGMEDRHGYQSLCLHRS